MNVFDLETDEARPQGILNLQRKNRHLRECVDSHRDSLDARFGLKFNPRLTGGAAASTVPDGAGLKVPPGDAAAFRDAVAALLDDPARRQRLADAAWQAGQSLPRWTDTAAVVASVLKRIGA